MFLDSIDKYMVQVAKNVFNNRSLAYQYLYQHWEDGSDPRTSSFYFVKFSNMGMITFMLMYVLSVWYLIPTFMRKRPAYNLKNAILFYDFFMVAMNGYFFIQSIKLSDYGRELVKFEDTSGDTSPKAMEYIRVANLYYISKLIDMLDTFFMAFRKRYSQITFLHLWHHVSLVWAAWAYMKCNPYTPSILIIPFVNSFIHMVMYSYYGLSSLGPQMRKYLWWKRYITQIQLIQFTMVFVWYLYICFIPQTLPLGYILANLVNSTFLFGLFLNFYIQSYKKTKVEQKKLE